MTIPSPQWRHSLDSLSRAYAGTMVSVDVEHPDFGQHAEVRTQPLSGISADRSGIIAQTARGTAHLQHTIAQPSALRYTETDEGALERVEIDGSDGATTTVRFGSPIRADLLDADVE